MVLNRTYTYSTAAPGSSTGNILSAGLEPLAAQSGYLRVYCCMSASGYLTDTVARGTTSVTETLNGGSKLEAGAAYIFDVPFAKGDSVNFQYSTIATINRLVIDERGG